MPPLPTVYQLMLLPLEVALRLAFAALHIVEGVALTDVGAEGKAVTPIVVVMDFVHPFPSVYVYLMTDDPADNPLKNPLLASILATDVDVLLQLPPIVELLNVVDAPLHTAELPVIAVNSGKGFTVID